MPSPVRVTFTTTDGVVLCGTYRDAGQRELGVLVAHGFTGSSRTPAVRRICEQLADDGMSVLTPDLRGHGRSGGRCTAGELEMLDVAAGVRWLRCAGYSHVAVLGWSMGGSAVLRYAGLGGDADAVVSVSSPGAWFERGTRPMRLVHWLCETRTGRLTCRITRGTRLAATGWSPVPQSPAEVAGAIAPRPLLIVHGTADHYFPLHHAHQLAEAAPHAQLWIEAGMGHAETATSPALLARIGGWVRSVVAAQSVCDDGLRE